MDEWFVCVPGGATVGPVSTSLLILGIRSGKVPDDALVCRRGEKTWRPVFEVTAFVDALPGAIAFQSGGATRYATKNLLGKGGMGEVHLCGDSWIGREVAMKVARPGIAAQPHLRARFVREALVQGQLEHPGIVPVYDLGSRPDGTTFFTMKRIHGLTLAAVIEGLRRGDAATAKAYSRRRLLTAMGSVCQAVSFAHSRGVVHRDLKPENVMLGDFGEVYVLDWGVARVLEDAWVQRPAVEGVAAPVGQTQAGALVGTPGYAAPEQVQGDRRVGEPSDVYALGAILFELLALVPLHQGASVDALVASTLAGGGARLRRDLAPSRDPPGARRHLRAGDGARTGRSLSLGPRDAGGARAVPRRGARRRTPARPGACARRRGGQGLRGGGAGRGGGGARSCPGNARARGGACPRADERRRPSHPHARPARHDGGDAAGSRGRAQGHRSQRPREGRG